MFDSNLINAYQYGTALVVCSVLATFILSLKILKNSAAVQTLGLIRRIWPASQLIQYHCKKREKKRTRNFLTKHPIALIPTNPPDLHWLETGFNKFLQTEFGVQTFPRLTVATKGTLVVQLQPSQNPDDLRLEIIIWVRGTGEKMCIRSECQAGSVNALYLEISNYLAGIVELYAKNSLSLVA